MVEVSMIFEQVLLFIFFFIYRAGKFNLVCESKRISLFGARFRNVHVICYCVKVSKIKVLKSK